MSQVDGNLLYTEDHEWVLVEDNILSIGISDYAQAELGDITFVELPEEGIDVIAGDEVANIESVKAASPVYAPVAGNIVEVNPELEESPEIINQDSYGAGWIFKMEVDAQPTNLMTADEYKDFLEKE